MIRNIRVKQRISRLTAVFTGVLAFSVSGVYADVSTIRGKVVDAGSGEPLAGAVIVESKTHKGIAATNDGTFSLDLASTDLPVTLSVDFLGYEPQQVEVRDTYDPLLVALAESVNYIDQVVVVGYGKQDRQSFTGSVTNVGARAFEDVPVQSFDQALIGQAAGVSVSLPNGLLNNPPVVRIRGINSISLSSFPLVVIDGIPVTTGNISSNSNVPNNPLADINPSDIESVDILKDAASTSIYGSRGAAGVLLITTKKGRIGKPRATYETSVSLTKATRLPKMLNAEQYMLIKNEAVYNNKLLSGNADNDAVASATFFPSYRSDGSLVETRWKDYIYQTGVSNNHVVTLSGGTEATRYYFSVNYSNQESMLVGNEFQRKGARFNIDQRVNNWLKISSHLTYNNTENKSYNSGSLPGQAMSTTGAARLALVLPNNVEAYNEDGSYNIREQGGQLGMGNNTVTIPMYNPVALFDLSRNTSTNNRFIGDVNANIRFLPSLEFNSTYAMDYLNKEDVVFRSSALGSEAYATGGSVSNIYNGWNNQDFTNTLGFDDRFGKHHVSALVGNEIQQQKFNNWGAKATNAADEFFQYYQGGWANVVADGNSRSEQVFVSYFGRLNYDYNNKYFLTGNFRRDGNSALAVGHKFGNFGGVSAGWVLTEEGFIRHSGLGRIFDNIKLTASWGRVGNGNLASAYNSYDLYSSGLYGDVSTWAYAYAGNADLSWETSNQTNVALALSTLDYRLNFELAFFNNNVNGLILSTPQSPSKGIPGNAILTNVGAMYNRGFEIGVNANLIQSDDFSWDASFNFTNVHNKVTALAAGNEDIIGYSSTTSNPTNITRVGHPIASLYGAKTAGVNPENGRKIFINRYGEKVQYSAAVANGESNWTYLDGTPAEAISTEDYYILGNSTPKWYGGLQTTFRYKQFDLGLNFTYAGGYHVMNRTQSTLRDQIFFNNSVDLLDRWTTPGQQTDIPRLVFNDRISFGANVPISDNVERGDFLRLQTVTLGYSLPDRFLQKIKLQSVRVYAQVNNAFLLTGYSGSDPEISTNGNSNLTPGVDFNSVGMGRIFTFGLNIGF